MDPTVWAGLLMVMGLALIALELFVPSGGVLTFLATSAVIGSVVMAFVLSGSLMGMLFLGFAAVAVPSAVLLGLKFWPRTALGRRVLLGVPGEDDVLPETDERDHFQAMIGQIGIARTVMLPGGTVEFDGRTFEAVSEGMSIEARQPVEVVQVRNNRLVVRPASEAPHRPKTPEERPADASDDILSRPIDQVGPDPFADPLS